MEKKQQTKAQRNGCLMNLRRGKIHRAEIASHVLPIAQHNPTIRTDLIVKQINKKMKSRKRTRNDTTPLSENTLQNQKEGEFKISEPEVIRAIKEYLHTFPKTFIDARKMELDKIVLRDQTYIDQNAYIDSFFNKGMIDKKENVKYEEEENKNNIENHINNNHHILDIENLQ